MPYTISDTAGTFSKALNSFFFYMPFSLTSQGSIQLIHSATAGCYLAVLVDGHPKTPVPADPDWKDGATAKEKVTIDSKENNVGTLIFQHMTLVNQIEIERENEWSELRIYHGDQPSVSDSDGPVWISTDRWIRRRGTPVQIADNFTKTFDFGSITDAPCDETVVVRNKLGDPQRVTLCRRMIAGTIAEVIMKCGAIDEGSGDVMPTLTLKTVGNSSVVKTVADRNFFTKKDDSGQINRSGYVLIAAGVFAYQSADTMLEEWRLELPGGQVGSGGGVSDFEDVRRRLGRIAFAPENMRSNGSRQLRKLYNVDFDNADGVTTGQGIDDAPVEVLFVEANRNGNIA